MVRGGDCRGWMLRLGVVRSAPPFPAFPAANGVSFILSLGGGPSSFISLTCHFGNVSYR